MPPTPTTRRRGTTTSALSRGRPLHRSQLGSRVAFVARFLGRRLSYTYEIVELTPSERLVMRTAEGPFPMETTYTWAPTTEGSTCTQARGPRS